jgi:hypothetical protein
MLTTFLERRQEREREKRERFAADFSEACAPAGFFGAETAHAHGGHVELPDPNCSQCVVRDPLRRAA